MPEPTKPSVAAREPHVIEFERKQALLEKVRTTRSSMLQNMAKVEGRKPDKHYSWINRDENRITHFQAQGYVICKDPDIKTNWKKEDGTHVRGDLILMETSAELHEVWKYEGELRAVEDLEASRDSFKAFAGKNQIPVNETRP